MSTTMGSFGKCEHSSNRQKERREDRSSLESGEQLHQWWLWTLRSSITKGGSFLGPGEVGFKLTEIARDDEGLRKALRQSLNQISKQIESASVEAFIDRDREDPSKAQIVLEVHADIDSVDRYQEIKEQVRSIVREAEKDDMMIYTRISRT